MNPALEITLSTAFFCLALAAAFWVRHGEMFWSYL